MTALENPRGALVVGRTLSHYRIVDEISRGGMGIVYRALDLKLNREVALKVLRPELLSEPDRKRRMLQEARVAAALRHPNIAVVYEIDEDEGNTFIAMELIDGHKLSDSLKKGALSAERALSIAIEVADGLAKAHEKGVVHRDVKPSNIILNEDGVAKLIDFGIAKLLDPATGSGSESETSVREDTHPGQILGTISYMSPEQARGAKVDHRTDVFSFGIVLYEMLAGHAPFRAPSGPEILSAIINAPVPALTVPAGDAGTDVRRVVEKCLAKDPSERYQGMNDLVVDLRALLRALQSAEGGERVRSSETPTIAVLPFSDLSPQKDQDYFCEGIAEEILNALTKIPGLRVAARTSAFRFHGDSRDIRTVGEALKVSSILQGSVRTAGKRLRITVQLVGVADGYHLWSERFDREMEDVFAIQDEIAQRVVEALRLKLVARTPMESKRSTGSIEAYQLYLKGRHNWFKRHKGSLQKAAHFFEEATLEDPSYARAYAGLADTYGMLLFYGFSPEVASTKARPACEKALALDDDLAEAHAAQGLIHFHLDWNWKGAEREYQRALDLNPAYVLPHIWYSFVFTSMGRHEEAIRLTRRAKELDPLSPLAITLAGNSLLWSGQTEAAMREYRNALDMDPENLLTLYFFGAACSRESRHEEAIGLAEKAVALAGRDSFSLAWLGWIDGAAGRREAAENLLGELSARAEREYVAPAFFAWVSSGLEDRDGAFAWLETGFQKHDPLMAWLFLPTLDGMRADDRFTVLLQKLNLAS